MADTQETPEAATAGSVAPGSADRTFAPALAAPPVEAGTPLESVAVRIGAGTYVVGTLWLSSPKGQVGPREARAWLEEQASLLPAYKALFIVATESAKERTDIGVCAIYKPGLRALSQVCAAHPEAFAAGLPQHVYRWGLAAETTAGAYLAVTSRDGLPLGERLVPLDEASAAKAALDAEFADIHWLEPLGREEFETRLAQVASGEPTALARASKTKIRIVQVLVASTLALAGLLVVRHYQGAERRLAALRAAAAAASVSRAPPGVKVGSVLNACLEAFGHVPGGTAGWSLVSAVCDAHQASFTWRRAAGALATTAPPGARVTADLRTAQTVIPLSPIHCVPDGRTRQAQMEVALSDWAVREHERWRAGGAAHPTLSIEGIVPSWELPAHACVRTVAVRWSHTGLWQTDMGW
ncbi:MAG: hypothetical protein ACYCT1_13600 [Steroidobacteraceae bacterium]